MSDMSVLLSHASIESKLTTVWSCGFYRAARMHSADYAVARCLSVCLSVSQSVCPSHAGILSKRLYISSKFFPPSLIATTLVIFHTERDGDIPTETP